MRRHWLNPWLLVRLERVKRQHSPQRQRSKSPPKNRKTSPKRTRAKERPAEVSQGATTGRELINAVCTGNILEARHKLHRAAQKRERRHQITVSSARKVDSTLIPDLRGSPDMPASLRRCRCEQLARVRLDPPPDGDAAQGRDLDAVVARTQGTPLQPPRPARAPEP